MPSEAGDPLTPREVAITFAVARGMTRKEIGKELGIAEATVSTHVGSIHRKLNVETAIDMLRALGLVVLPSEERVAELVDLAGLRAKLDALRVEIDAASDRITELGEMS